MENLLETFSKLLGSNKNGASGIDPSTLSSLLPLFSSFMENNKGATAVAPEDLSQKLNILIRTTS